MDLRHLVPRSTLYLPVEVEGALFFADDGHGAQGDGEVCITGLETGVSGTLRLSVDRRKKVSELEFVTFRPLNVDAGAAGDYGTTAAGPDLFECRSACGTRARTCASASSRAGRRGRSKCRKPSWPHWSPATR